MATKRAELRTSFKKMISQEELKKQVNYSPKTGVFTRLIAESNNANIGDVAGNIFGKGYVRFEIKGRAYLAHRLAFLYMTGEMPRYTDHINHIRHDNRWVNLRKVTQTENQRNASKRKDNRSGVTGVVLVKKTGKLQARIVINRKTKYLGTFDDFFEAVCTRKSAEVRYNFHENHGKVAV